MGAERLPFRVEEVRGEILLPYPTVFVVSELACDQRMREWLRGV
jgi:hypothetical protein